MPLEKTRKALAHYDELDDEIVRMKKSDDWEGKSNSEVINMLTALEVRGREVGFAFGLDTGQNTEKCQTYVRPGSKNPSPGFRLSLVRRMVAKEIQREGGENHDD